MALFFVIQCMSVARLFNQLHVVKTSCAGFKVHTEIVDKCRLGIIQE